MIHQQKTDVSAVSCPLPVWLSSSLHVEKKLFSVVSTALHCDSQNKSKRCQTLFPMGQKDTLGVNSMYVRLHIYKSLTHTYWYKSKVSWLTVANICLKPLIIFGQATISHKQSWPDRANSSDDPEPRFSKHITVITVCLSSFAVLHGADTKSCKAQQQNSIYLFSYRLHYK